MTKVILCAYHDAGKRVLEHLLTRSDIGELALFTHEPPKHVPDIRELATSAGVWHSVEDVSRSNWPFEPDVIASVYYRYIIRPDVIRRVGGKIFNLHPSLLPRHRGASSVPWAIFEGDELTGVTFHYIDEGIDTGPIILQVQEPVLPDETQASLYQRLMDIGVDKWPAAFKHVLDGQPGIPQTGPATYHRRGALLAGEIDDAWTDELVERFIRAMTYPPYPYARYLGQEVRSIAEYIELRTVMAGRH